MNISIPLKELRKHLNVSQEGLARLLQITVRTVSRFETGDAPSVPMLLRLEGIARESGLSDLAERFHTAWELDTRQRTKGLLSPGTARRIPVSELQTLHKSLLIISEQAPENADLTGQVQRMLTWLQPYLGVQ